METLECKKQCTICYNKECTQREAEPTLSEEEMEVKLKDLADKVSKFIKSKDGEEIKAILRKSKSINDISFTDRKRIMKIIKKSGFNKDSVSLAVLISNLI